MESKPITRERIGMIRQFVTTQLSSASTMFILEVVIRMAEVLYDIVYKLKYREAIDAFGEINGLDELVTRELSDEIEKQLNKGE
jgi:hypothetical protein